MAREVSRGLQRTCRVGGWEHRACCPWEVSPIRMWSLLPSSLLRGLRDGAGHQERLVPPNAGHQLELPQMWQETPPPRAFTFAAEAGRGIPSFAARSRARSWRDRLMPPHHYPGKKPRPARDLLRPLANWQQSSAPVCSPAQRCCPSSPSLGSSREHFQESEV